MEITQKKKWKKKWKGKKLVASFLLCSGRLPVGRVHSFIHRSRDGWVDGADGVDGVWPPAMGDTGRARGGAKGGAKAS